MTTGPEGERPGLQPERTLLAWTRTLLAAVVAAGLLVRLLGPPLVRPAHLPAVLVLGVVLWLFLAADRRYRHATARVEVVRAGPLLALAGSVATVGVVAVVALLAR